MLGRLVTFCALLLSLATGALAQSYPSLAKQKPGALNYGSAGNGSAGHLAFEYPEYAADIRIE